MLSNLTEKDIEQIAQQVTDAAKGIATQQPTQEPPKQSKETAKGPSSSGDTDDTNEPTKQPDMSKEELSEQAKKNLEAIRSQILANMAGELTQKVMNQELVVLAREAGVSSCHTGIQRRVVRMQPTERGAQEYMQLHKKQSSYLKALTRQLERAFTDMSVGARKRHQVTGTMFKASDAHRLDGLCFESKRARSDDPEIAITVLVDQSGSMGGSRMEHSKSAALLVYEFCRNLNIPCMVCGHSTNNGMNFNIFSDFRPVESDKYAIAEMCAMNADNLDGMAIQIAASMLEKRPEPVRLLMIISDGQPNNMGYYGRAAEEDIKKIVKAEERKDVDILAFAIGDDKDRIKDIYGEKRFVDISDLSTMPKTLSKIVRRRIVESMF